jgi:hypothetical protein
MQSWAKCLCGHSPKIFSTRLRAPTSESSVSGGLLTLEKLLARKGSACVMVDSRSSNYALPAE